MVFFLGSGAGVADFGVFDRTHPSTLGFKEDDFVDEVLLIAAGLVSFGIGGG